MATCVVDTRTRADCWLSACVERMRHYGQRLSDYARLGAGSAEKHCGTAITLDELE